MQSFVELIANMMKPYLARVGGPIIMAQIENEYHNTADQAYIDWCGDLAMDLALDIPWYALWAFVAAVTPVTDCLRSQGHVQRYVQLRAEQ